MQEDASTSSVFFEEYPYWIANASARTMLDCAGWMNSWSGFGFERGRVAVVEGGGGERSRISWW